MTRRSRMFTSTLDSWSIYSTANTMAMQLSSMAGDTDFGRGKASPIGGSMPAGPRGAELRRVYSGFQESVSKWLNENDIRNGSGQLLKPTSGIHTVEQGGMRVGKRLMMHNFAGTHQPMPAGEMHGVALNDFVLSHIEGTNTPMKDVVRLALDNSSDRIRSTCKQVGKVAALLHVVGWELYFEDIEDEQ